MHAIDNVLKTNSQKVTDTLSSVYDDYFVL